MLELIIVLFFILFPFVFFGRLLQMGGGHLVNSSSAESKLSAIRQNAASIDKEKYYRINSEDGEYIIIISKDGKELEVACKKGNDFKRFELSPGSIKKTFVDDETTLHEYKKYRLEVFTSYIELPKFHVEFVNYRVRKKGNKIKEIKDKCTRLEAAILAFNDQGEY